MLPKNMEKDKAIINLPEKIEVDHNFVEIADYTTTNKKGRIDIQPRINPISYEKPILIYHQKMVKHMTAVTTNAGLQIY